MNNEVYERLWPLSSVDAGRVEEQLLRCGHAGCAMQRAVTQLARRLTVQPRAVRRRWRERE